MASLTSDKRGSKQGSKAPDNVSQTSSSKLRSCCTAIARPHRSDPYSLVTADNDRVPVLFTYVSSGIDAIDVTTPTTTLDDIMYFNARSASYKARCTRCFWAFVNLANAPLPYGVTVFVSN